MFNFMIALSKLNKKKYLLKKYIFHKNIYKCICGLSKWYFSLYYTVFFVYIISLLGSTCRPIEFFELFDVIPLQSNTKNIY